MGFEETNIDKWYSVFKADFIKHHGGQLIRRYGGSPSLTLKSVYPNIEWEPWRFKAPPHRMWKDVDIQKRFLSFLGTKLGFSSFEDWYKLTTKSLLENGGRGLLVLYKDVPSIVRNVLGYSDALTWKFASVPGSYWKKKENRMRYLEWLMSNTGATSLEKLRVSDFQDFNGMGLLNTYGGSPKKVILSIVASNIPIASLGSVDSQRRFLEKFAETVGFDPNDEEAWYKVRTADLHKHGAKWLLQSRYRTSLYLLLKSTFPEIEWKSWKFGRISKSFLRDPKSIPIVLDYLRDFFEIRLMEDWDRVSAQHIEGLKLKGFVDHYGGLRNLIQMGNLKYSEE